MRSVTPFLLWGIHDCELMVNTVFTKIIFEVITEVFTNVI